MDATYFPNISSARRGGQIGRPFLTNSFSKACCSEYWCYQLPDSLPLHPVLDVGLLQLRVTSPLASRLMMNSSLVAPETDLISYVVPVAATTVNVALEVSLSVGSTAWISAVVAPVVPLETYSHV